MTFGLDHNFPANVHRVEGFHSNLSSRKLQQKILKTLQEVNRHEFTFEEVTTPVEPQGIVIFEFGLSDGGGFCYLDEELLKKAVNAASKTLQVLDFFCSIRYYKGNGEKRTPLKFDYYLMRNLFGKDALEVQVFHERGPRYVSPEDLIAFLVCRVNGGQKRKTLQPLAPQF